MRLHRWMTIIIAAWCAAILASDQPASPTPDKPSSTAAAPLPAGPPGRIVLEESGFDYGTMNQGEELKHDFVIRNKGTGPLVLEEIILTCGCTVAMPDTKQIAPGGSPSAPQGAQRREPS